MTKTEYMNSLQKHLKRLSKEDMDKALEYFEEYFSDAGESNELKAMEDLGTPFEAAEQIITSMAIANTKEPVKDMKKGLNAVWVGILAVFAAPIALPLALSFVVVILMFILAIFLLLFCGYLAGAVLLISAPLNIVAGFTQLMTGFPYFLTCLGAGLMSCGLGLLIIRGMNRLSRSFLSCLIQLFGRIATKEKKKF